MTVAIARTVLVAASGVTTLVAVDQIEALRRTQTLSLPAITLTAIAKSPFNHLRGHAGLDLNQVQINALAVTYTEALAIATAVRAAMQAAGHLLISQLDLNEPETDPELFQIAQTWSVYS